MSRRPVFMLVLACAAGLAAFAGGSRSAPAQGPDPTASPGGSPAGLAEAAPESARGPAPAPRQPGVWPPVSSSHGERGFARGNYRPLPGSPRVVGHYLNWFSLAVLLGAFALWTWSSHWVDEDSRGLKLRTEFWNSVMLGCGVAAFLAALCLPNFLFSLLALAGLFGLPLGLYVRERNARVPESARVLTPDHLQGVLIRALARVGIHLGAGALVEATVGPPIRFLGKSQTGRGMDESRSRQVENSKGFLAAKELIYDAILRRATDVHLEPKEDEFSVRIRIDGVMYPTEPFDRPTGEAIVNIFKVLSAMDITERRRPQDGSFRAQLEARQIDFRVATQGTSHGQKLSLRILDQSNSVSNLPGLGLRKQLLESLREVIHSPHGLMLVCGPTGAGKSTTLYACLNDIDRYQRNVITVEDPIEYRIDNVNQIEINTKSGQTFANSLRSILRQDPDVVMIGEIRDGETANIACQAANTGHMVFSTVHANDTITALYRMLELGVEPYMTANSLTSIVGQRLARRLCPACREAYKPKPEILKRAGLPPSRIEQFYRPPRQTDVPCEKCQGLGYFGRVGVYEVLVITDRMRDLIRDKAPASAIKAEARKNGMLTMKEEGLRLVVRGVTSIEELLRVVK